MSKQTDYQQLAQTILKQFDFESVLEIGCGEGYLLNEFKKANKRIRGYDLPQDTWKSLKEIERDVVMTDINKPFESQADLVICLEVVEHSPTPLYIFQNIIRNTKRYIIFSGAQINQPGVGHINCYPYSCWMYEFARRGYAYKLNKTINLLKELSFDTCWWLLNNLAVFEKEV